VAFVQVDNELAGIHEWFGGFDHHPDVMGYGKDEGPWADFKRERPGAPYRDFYLRMVAEYAGVLADWTREAGIDCPIIHNAANPGMASYFLETKKRIGKDFFLGVDMYYNLGMDFVSNNPSPKQAADVFLGLEQLRLLGYPPTVLEMQSGNCADWPPVAPEDLECWLRLNLAFGMKGVNYYVFAGGPNPAHIGGDGDMYDYNAPIGPNGEIRPIYRTLEEFGRLLSDNPWLAEAELESDFRLGLDWSEARAKSPLWDFLKKGVLITSLCSSRAPELWDIRSEAPQDGKPLLVCAGMDMPEETQRSLANFVERGGKLAILGALPGLLQEFIGAGACSKALGEFELCFKSLENVDCLGLWLSDPPEVAKPLARDRVSGKAAGWRKDIKKGAVLWLGAEWKFSKTLQRDMFISIMDELGASQSVQCSSPYVWAVSRRRGNRRMLFAMNLFSSPMRAAVQASGAQPVELALRPMEVWMAEV
jgi:hypothetical protein